MEALVTFIPLALLMWLFLIRPQQQRVRRQQALIRALEVGDDVITLGGLYGTIVAVDDEDVVLEVAPGTTLRFVRAAISRRLDDAVAEEPAATPDTEID